MKKYFFLIGFLSTLFLTNLCAEFRAALGLDAYTNVWGFGKDESLMPSVSSNLGYLLNSELESVKFGIGASFWAPRSPEESGWDVTFSDISVYGTVQIYPFIALNLEQKILSPLYIKGNFGYHYPIMFGDFLDLVDSYWGGITYGVGGGYEISSRVFMEVLYSGSYWGMDVYHGGNPRIKTYDMGAETFSLILGIKI